MDISVTKRASQFATTFLFPFIVQSPLPEEIRQPIYRIYSCRHYYVGINLIGLNILTSKQLANCEQVACSPGKAISILVINCIGLPGGTVEFFVRNQ